VTRSFMKRWHGQSSVAYFDTRLIPRYPPTDEVFFVQNAGAVAAGTGLKKSAITQKISLAQAAQAASQGSMNATNVVDVVTVDANPPIINPNGESFQANPSLTVRSDKLQRRPAVHGRGSRR
jgi:hypothetical protein